MATHQNRFGCAGLDLQLRCLREQTAHHFGDLRWFWRTPQRVGSHDEAEALDIFRLKAFGQTPDRTVSNRLQMSHMISHQREHSFDDGLGNIDAMEKTFRERDTDFLVAWRNDSE